MPAHSLLRLYHRCPAVRMPRLRARERSRRLIVCSSPQVATGHYLPNLSPVASAVVAPPLCPGRPHRNAPPFPRRCERRQYCPSCIEPCRGEIEVLDYLETLPRYPAITLAPAGIPPACTKSSRTYRQRFHLGAPKCELFE